MSVRTEVSRRLQPPRGASAARRLRVFLIAGMAVLGLALQWLWISKFLGAAAPSVRYP